MLIIEGKWDKMKKPPEKIRVEIKGRLLEQLNKRANQSGYDHELHELARILIKKELKGGK